MAGALLRGDLRDRRRLARRRAGRRTLRPARSPRRPRPAARAASASVARRLRSVAPRRCVDRVRRGDVPGQRRRRGRLALEPRRDLSASTSRSTGSSTVCRALRHFRHVRPLGRRRDLDHACRPSSPAGRGAATSRVDSTRASGPRSSRTARSASLSVFPRYRFRCMSVQCRHRDDRNVRRHLVVRQHAEVRQHPREQPPQVRPERW